MMFDTRVPESMASLPGRKVTHWEVEPPRANAAPVAERECKVCHITYPLFCFEKNQGKGYVWYKRTCKLCQRRGKK